MKDDRKRIVATGYDALAGRYAEWARQVQGDPRARVLRRFARRLQDGARVLELGCGAGIPSTRQLADRFEVVGVDISRVQLELARRNAPRASFVHADITDIQFPEASFDGVAALYVISHVPREEHGQLFSSISNWLVPGGSFVATLSATDDPDWRGEWLGSPMFFSSYGADTNRSLLRAAGFDLVFDEVIEHREPEGRVSFLWVIARKRPDL